MATGLPSGSEDLPLLQKGWELVRSLPERQEEDESEWEEDEVFGRSVNKPSVALLNFCRALSGLLSCSRHRV